MNYLILKTGRLSALICLISFAIWIISFTGIALSSPLFYWTNLTEYIDYVNKYPQFFPNLAKSFLIVFSLAYMMLIFVFHEFTSKERQLFAKLAMAFALIFALVSSVHYFIQISTVRFAIEGQDYTGLEHFLQAKPTSFISSMNMIGWTLYLGLSTLFAYLSFRNKTGKRLLKFGLLSNTISCLLAGIGYLFQIDSITFIFINIGMGGSMIIISIAAIKMFKQR